MTKKLAQARIRKKLPSIPRWSFRRGKLCRTFKFKDFVEAFSFMTTVAFEAEKLNHHPEWTNVYSSVKISLETHDAGGLSELDFKLAAKIDRIAFYSGSIR